MPRNSKSLRKNYIAIDASALTKENKTGVEWYADQLLKHLSKEWKETDPPIVLLTPKKLETRFKNKNWYCRTLPGKYFWTQIQLKRFLKRYPPKLIFSPTYVPPRFLPKKIFSVCVVHGLEGELFPEFRTFKEILTDYFLIRPTLDKVRSIIAVSEHTKKDLNFFFDIPLEKIKVVLSGPGTLEDNFDYSLKPLAGFKEKGVKFLLLGGSNERKNLFSAVRIFSFLKTELDCQTSLRIAGNLDKKAQRLLSQGRGDIIQLGYLSEEEKIKELKEADFLLYPSFYEGFGFPVLESQAFGTVPIVINNSGLDEVGGDGIVEFDLQKEKESVKKIVGLIKKPDKYRELQVEGLKNFRRFSWQTCAQQIKEVLINSTK